MGCYQWSLDESDTLLVMSFKKLHTAINRLEGEKNRSRESSLKATATVQKRDNKGLY